MTATLTETVLTVDGIRSPMVQAGPPHADEAVVFVHGNPGSSQDWARLVERTGRLARAVAWDHPGFGQADKPTGFDYTVQGYAAHLGRCQATDPGMPGCSGWPMPSPPAGGSGPWKARAGMGPG